MIVARELDIRTVDTISVKSYSHQSQGEAKVLKSPDPSVVGDGTGVLIIDDLVDGLGIGQAALGEVDATEWIKRLAGTGHLPPGVQVNTAVAMERVGALLNIVRGGDDGTLIE